MLEDKWLLRQMFQKTTSPKKNQTVQGKILYVKNRESLQK